MSVKAVVRERESHFLFRCHPVHTVQYAFLAMNYLVQPVTMCSLMCVGKEEVKHSGVALSAGQMPSCRCTAYLLPPNNLPQLR